MKAAYLLIDVNRIKDWQSWSEDRLIDALNAEESRRPDNVLYIDDSWDILHYLLCERTTAQPIEGNALSEAIVGVNWFEEDDEAAAFIAFSMPPDIVRIHDAIRKIRAEELPVALDYQSLKDAGVYQADWVNQEPEWASETVMHDFADLQRLYSRALAEKSAMVVSFL